MEEELSGHRHKPLLVPILYESDEEMLHSRTVREIQIASNFAVLKSSISTRNDETTMPAAKRIKSATSEKEQQQYDLAIKTALLVQKEIEQWENSIRELEIILSRPDQPQHRCQHSTHRPAVDALDAHETSPTIARKDNDAPVDPHRSISVSSTETRVAVIDEDDVCVVAHVPGPAVWEKAAPLPAFELTNAFSSASSSST